jgi:hypothetical protein
MNMRLWFGVFALAAILLPSPARAQYLFLDTNGDGVFTAADKLHPVHATTVDLWLDTAHNRDGSVASCGANPASPLNLSSYVVNLEATSGAVSYSAYTNQVPGMSLLPGTPAANETDFSTGFFRLPIVETLPPGKYLLGTLTVTVAAGSPSVDIVPSLGAPFVDPTLFGSYCPGQNGNYSLALGRDWFDVDGLDRPGKRRGALAADAVK